MRTLRSFALIALVGSAIVGCGGSEEGPAPLGTGEPTGGTGEPSGPQPGGHTPGGPTTPTPETPETPEQTPKTDPAAGVTAFAWDEGTAPSADFAAAAKALLAGCAQAATNLDALGVEPAFIDEGKLSTDPARMRTMAIAISLKDLLPRLGYCARLVNPTQAASREAIVRYVKRFAAVYVGGVNADPLSDDDDPGNPINEWHLYPVVLAADMIYPKLEASDRKVFDDLFVAADARVAAFMNALTATDDRRKSAWATDALVLRSAAALVRGDSAKSTTLATAVADHVTALYVPPATYVPSTCANLAGIGAYGSLELQRRDALNSHMFPLGLLLQLASLRPGYLSAASMTRLAAAIEVARPYVSGAKVHQEYVCSTIAYDRQQQAAGTPGWNGPWDPMRDRDPFRFGRIALPATKAWTTAYATPNYAPWVRVFVAGKGD